MTARGPALGLVLVMLMPAAGCNRSLPKESLDRAQAAVDTALSAWQEGGRIDALASRPEPIQFAEELWPAGHQLVSYRIKETVGETKEGIIRCFAVLTLKDRKGRQSEREVAYQVTLGPPIVIARDPYF